MKIVLSGSKILSHYLHPSSGARFVALDVGSSVVGVAVSGLLKRNSIVPVENIHRQAENNMSPDEIRRFSSSLNGIIDRYDAKVVVVGLPVFRDSLGPFAKEIIQLMKLVEIPQKASPVVCTFFDESFTSKAAGSICGTISKSKFLEVKDGISAVVLLRDFFQANS